MKPIDLTLKVMPRQGWPYPEVKAHLQNGSIWRGKTRF